MRGKRLWLGGLSVFLVAIWAVAVDLLTNATASSLGNLTEHRGVLIATLAVVALLAGVVAVWQWHPAGGEQAGVRVLNSGVPAGSPGMLSLLPPADLPEAPVRGRDAVISELSGLFGRRKRNTARVHVLCGLGGSGKTTIAGAVAHRLRRRGIDVWWISAATDLQAGMRELARELGSDEQQIDRAWAGLRSAPDLLWELLENRSARWLLVIDNADDVGALVAKDEAVAAARGWLRPIDSRRGAIVVTSRAADAASWAPWCQLHPVGILSAEDGARVLVDHAGTQPGTWNEAIALADQLGGLPLALRLAGRHLANSNRVRLAGSIDTYDAYRKAYSKSGTAAVFGTGGGAMTDEQARRIIDRTWELSLNLLQRRGFGAARPLLRLLACLADAPIPYELVLNPQLLAGSNLFGELDATRLRELLDALAGMSLIELDTHGASLADTPPSLRLHALVRGTGRDHLDASGQTASFLLLTIKLLGHAARVAGDPEEPARWSLWYPLLPHVTQAFHEAAKATDLADDALPEAASLALRAARHLMSGGLYPAAEVACQEIADACAARRGATDPVTLRARAQLAELTGATGQPEEARTALAALLPLLVTALGETHSDTLTVRAALARWTGEAGDPAAALEQLTKLVPLYTAAFGEEHAETLRIQANLASATRDAATARDRFTHLVAVYERVRGSTHPDTLRARANLAEATGTAGDPAAARDQLAAVADCYEKIYGPDHPETLRARVAQAGWIGAAGATKLAGRALTELRPRLVAAFGEAHPETARLDAELGYLDTARPPRRGVAFRPSAAPILVTGATGAGKTRLVETWTRGDATPTLRSTNTEWSRLAGKRRILARQVLTVVPGTVSREKDEALARATALGRSPSGLIHVVCWGFDSRWARGDAWAHDEDSAVSAEQRRELLRQDNLQQEVDEFRSICDRLAEAWARPRTSPKRPWLVIAVTKADLFWERIDEALNYYGGDRAVNPFARALHELTQRVGPVSVAVVPVSTGPGLDAQHRRELLTRLSTTVEGLLHGRMSAARGQAEQRIGRNFWA